MLILVGLGGALLVLVSARALAGFCAAVSAALVWCWWLDRHPPG
ncbi:MAG TPA: hypothetical protein VJ813_14920 [Vicinamibacterales bacterium]|nr:hypothetical protein [Vicinamibacterales bacterium]